jgi:energy-coupling factor transport system permease protein
MMSLDLYVQEESWLHRADPRVKLLFVVEMAVLLLLWPNLPFTLAVLVGCHLMLATARVSCQRVLAVWRVVLPLMLLIVVLWLPMMPDSTPTLLQVWRLRVSLPALLRGLLMATRLGGLAFLFFTWLANTEQRAIIQGMVRLGLRYEWGLTLALAMRYLPTLQVTYLQVVDAQRARGLDLSEGSFMSRARRRLPILVPLLVTALRSSENVGRALEARALGMSGVRRTVLHDLHLARADYFYLAVLLLGPLVGYLVAASL